MSLPAAVLATREKRLQHDRFVRKLHEAEAEARYCERAVTQEELDATMRQIFNRWGV